MGARLRRSIRDADTVARFGGDEFTVVLESLTGEADTDPLVQRIGAELSRPFQIGEVEVIVGASIGVGIYPRDGADAETLLANADAAMYEGKETALAGHHRIRFYTVERHAAIRHRLERETALRRAVELEQLEVHYQPQWTADGERVTGVEALVRWRHPQRGLLPPAEFVALAERIGLIAEIDSWVMGEAARRLAGWHADGFAGLRLAVNISSQTFYDPELARRIAAIGRRQGLPPERLELELTESMVVSESGAARARLQELRQTGVSLAFDDFGTGQSSLQYLTVFLPDRIKIDRSFVRRLGREPKFWAVVGGVIDIARRLEIDVTAEGVEEEEVRARLATQGCQEVQGYLLSRPLPAAEVTELLRRRRAADPPPATHARAPDG